MGRRRRVHSRTTALLRTLRDTLRLDRLRRLWMQCDLFDTMVVQKPLQKPLQKPRAEIAQPVPPRSHIAPPPQKRRSSCERVGDVAIIERLLVAHADYNATLFGGELTRIRMRISRRMKNRLGHYMVAGGGQSAEIAMSLRHVERDPWGDVLYTLVHEMVHQWQDQNGMALDHGRAFRVKAREVGISTRATRPATGTVQPRLAARASVRRWP